MRPTQRCVLLFVAGIPVALLPAIVSDALWTLWVVFVALAVLATGLDAALGLPARHITVRTRAPDILYIGEPDPLILTVTVPPGRRGLPLEILTDLDANLTPQPLRTVEVGEDHEAELEVPLVPLRRGTVRVHAVWVRWAGPLGLIRRQARFPAHTEVAVVPNIRAVRSAALRFFSSRQFVSGLKVEHYLGDGSEFESLREYAPGFDTRAIHWKASARHRKLLCQEFRAERNHQIIIAVDSGHLMSEPLDGVARLDHAINAGLLLSYFSLKSGDRIGFFGFDEKVRAFSDPQSGVGAFQRLQRLSASLDYSTSETNFTLGLAELSLRLHRRSLVVLLTDFVDTITAELMVESVDRLARRHVVLFVTLRDPRLHDLADARPAGLDPLYRSVVAEDFIRERDVVLRRLRRMGIHCIDAAPTGVTVSLLNRYLDIKRRELV